MGRAGLGRGHVTCRPKRPRAARRARARFIDRPKIWALAGDRRAAAEHRRTRSRASAKRTYDGPRPPWSNARLPSRTAANR